MLKKQMMEALAAAAAPAPADAYAASAVAAARERLAVDATELLLLAGEGVLALMQACASRGTGRSFCPAGRGRSCCPWAHPALELKPPLHSFPTHSALSIPRPPPQAASTSRC